MKTTFPGEGGRAGCGTTSHVCIVCPSITSETLYALVFPSPARLPIPSNKTSLCKDQEKALVLWGWKEKQLQRHKLLILIFQKKKKLERTWVPRKKDSIWLWCVHFHRTGAAQRIQNSEEEGSEEVEVAWQLLRNYKSCGEAAQLDNKSACHAAIWKHQRTSQRGKGKPWPLIGFLGEGVCPAKDYCFMTLGVAGNIDTFSEGV